jgi:RsiW-degrading membrane proteinase PrsW (M82 family)
MPKINILLSNNPNIIILALLGGMIPSILWLFFWQREDTHHREPLGLLIMTFIAGMLSVIFVLPIEKAIATSVSGDVLQTTLWAVSEEVIKFLAFAAIMLKSPFLDEPVEYATYCMTAALGFAALENTLFLIHPLAQSDTVVSLLTGNLRFLGATLLHSVTSGLVGAAIGLAYFKSRSTKFFYGIVGMCGAICLHSVFNFFIMKNNGENFLQVFGFLWVTAIIIMLLFEKLRRMSAYVQDHAPHTASY